MQNPQVFPSMINAKEMHKYNTHANIPWNIAEYEVPALHFDQKQIVLRRQYAAQKKGVKTNDFYLTKRGYYMDYDLKIAKQLLGPGKYKKNELWTSRKQQLSGQKIKSARSSIKYSYLDLIEIQQKNRIKPGVGTFNLAKSMQDLQAEQQKLKQKKITYGQKRYFYEQTQNLSNVTPGIGTYNPHLSVDKIKLNKTDHKFWIDKHGKNDKLNTTRELARPNPASYSPTNQSYDTFQRTFSLPKKDRLVKNGFGSDARFPYVRQNKKVIIQQRPAPCQYETRIQWKGKGNMSAQKKRWSDIIYTGSPPKVYH